MPCTAGVGYTTQGSDWLKASPEFEQVVRRLSGGTIPPERSYRLAEVQFNLKNFERAISSYQQLLREFPQDKLAPSARFRVGLGISKGR